MKKLADDKYELQNYESIQPDDNSSSSAAQPSQSRPKQYTSDEAIEEIGFGKFQGIMLLVLGFSWLVDASEILVLSVVPLYLQCEWKIDKVQIAWITTSVFLGMTISSPIIGWICDQYGRKRGILLAMVFGIIMSILSSFSPKYQWFVLSRFLVGVSLGGMTQVVGYASEFIPKKQRRYVTLGQLFWPVGGVMASLIGIATLHGLSWRYYILVMCVPPVIGAIFLMQMPESFRYLLAAGKYKEAKAALRMVAKMNGKRLEVDELVLDTGPSNKKYDTDNAASRGNIFKLFGEEHWKTTILIAFLQFCIGMCYYGMVMLTTNYFRATEKICIAKTPGANGLLLEFNNCLYCRQLTLKNYLELAWTSFAEAPGDIATFFLLELVGRKRTLFIESAFVLISSFILLFCTTWGVEISCLFIARGVSQGAAVALQAYTPEVYPTSLRGIGVGFGNLWFRCGAMITPFLAQVAIYKSVKGTILCYVVFMLLSMIASFLLPIETRGRPLDNVD